jgi:hypothetical protein
MKQLGLALGLITLSYCVACGGGSSNNGGGGPTPQGTFTNASLSGQYAFQLRGTNLNNGAAFTEAGVFTADGNGHLSGTDDYSESGGGGLSTDNISGTYLIRNDGLGVANLTFSAGGTITLAFTLLSSSRLYLIEDDGFAASAGSGIKQDSTAFSAAPSGTFAFKIHTSGPSSQGSTASVGQLTVAAGNATGNEDVLRGGIRSQLTMTGFFNVPDTTGRGTGTLTDGALQTYTFTYYVVDANNVLLLVNSLNGVQVAGAASAVAQSGAPFTNASLSGNYAFGSKGDSLNAEGVGTVGRFTADGLGAISAGEYDSNVDGITSTDVTFTGSYGVASNGRGAATLSPSVGGTTHEIFWMISPTRAFFLVDDPSKVEDGSLDAQQGTFSNSTLTGQFAFLMHGFTATPDTFDRVGTLRPDGTGNMNLAYFLNVSFTPSVTPVTLSGTYTMGSSGRGTGTVSTLSNNLVFYLISGNDGYILQNDTGAAINGNMTKQQ